jgi:hypothetical protein
MSSSLVLWLTLVVGLVLVVAPVCHTSTLSHEEQMLAQFRAILQQQLARALPSSVDASFPSPSKPPCDDTHPTRPIIKASARDAIVIGWNRASWDILQPTYHWVMNQLLGDVTNIIVPVVRSPNSLINTQQHLILVVHSITSDIEEQLNQRASNHDLNGMLGIIIFNPNSNTFCSHAPPPAWLAHVSFVLHSSNCNRAFACANQRNNVFWVPLGWRYEPPALALHQTLSATDRLHLFSFAATFSNKHNASLTRVLAHLHSSPANYSYKYHWITKDQPLSLYDYQQQFLAQSTFSLCFANQYHQCVFDSLASGTIPICERSSPIVQLLGAPPIPLIADWSEASVLLEYYLNDRAKLLRLQQLLNKWWLEYQQSLRHFVAQLLVD